MFGFGNLNLMQNVRNGAAGGDTGPIQRLNDTAFAMNPNTPGNPWQGFWLFAAGVATPGDEGEPLFQNPIIDSPVASETAYEFRVTCTGNLGGANLQIRLLDSVGASSEKIYDGVPVAEELILTGTTSMPVDGVSFIPSGAGSTTLHLTSPSLIM